MRIWATRCWSPRGRRFETGCCASGADVMGVPTLVIARTVRMRQTSDHLRLRSYDSGFITGERTSEGFYRTHAGGIEGERSAAVWRMPRMPSGMVRKPLRGSPNWRVVLPCYHAVSGQSCWPITVHASFNWQKNLDDKTLPASSSGCRTWVANTSLLLRRASRHVVQHVHGNWRMRIRAGRGHQHYVEKVQQRVRRGERWLHLCLHQQEVGTGYFDKVTTIIQGGASSVTALTSHRRIAVFD